MLVFQTMNTFNPDPDPVTTMGLSLPISLKNRLDAVVARHQRNRSNVIKQAIIEFLDRVERAQQRGVRK
jgi:metal-responsive CopG/Arc/MetJ family transcriptional regulator